MSGSTSTASSVPRRERSSGWCCQEWMPEPSLFGTLALRQAGRSRIGQASGLGSRSGRFPYRSGGSGAQGDRARVPARSLTGTATGPEAVWPLVNERVANRLFEDLDELEEALVERCLALSEQTELLRGSTNYHWWPEAA